MATPFYSLIESAKLAGAAPRAYLGQAARRAIRKAPFRARTRPTIRLPEGRGASSMVQAAIKGSALIALIEDVVHCVEQGRASAETLEVRLEPEDFALLEEKVSPAKWYPIDQYRRLTDLLFELAGEGRDFETYMKARGAAAAERLIRSGLYQQLDYSAIREEASPERMRSETRLRVSLIASIVNRGSARVEPDPDRPGQTRIDLRDVGELPDCLGHTIAGFIERCAHERGSGGRWYMARVGADLMRFTYEPDER